MWALRDAERIDTFSFLIDFFSHGTVRLVSPEGIQDDNIIKSDEGVVISPYSLLYRLCFVGITVSI